MPDQRQPGARPSDRPGTLRAQGDETGSGARQGAALYRRNGRDERGLPARAEHRQPPGRVRPSGAGHLGHLGPWLPERPLWAEPPDRRSLPATGAAPTRRRRCTGGATHGLALPALPGPARGGPRGAAGRPAAVPGKPPAAAYPALRLRPEGRGALRPGLHARTGPGGGGLDGGPAQRR
ncbi:hypothetical protein D9M69_524540 [compost metagenome]